MKLNTLRNILKFKKFNINEYKHEIKYVFPDIEDEELDDLLSIISDYDIDINDVKSEVEYLIDELTKVGKDVQKMTQSEFIYAANELARLDYPEELYKEIFKQLTTDPDQLSMFEKHKDTKILKFKRFIINENKEKNKLEFATRQSMF